MAAGRRCEDCGRFLSRYQATHSCKNLLGARLREKASEPCGANWQQPKEQTLQEIMEHARLELEMAASTLADLQDRTEEMEDPTLSAIPSGLYHPLFSSYSAAKAAFDAIYGLQDALREAGFLFDSTVEGY